MILVKKDDEWPLVRERDPESQMWKPVEASLAQVVVDGVINWKRQSGREPTDVIFGRKACNKLREELNLSLMVYDPTSKENKYHGLTFHRDYDTEGVVLLTRQYAP